tara:strand:+ start:104 stop:259 length:156 start_codon:yes stop_codon:yes gene_type:complete
MDNYTRLIQARKDKAKEQIKRDALTYYLTKGHPIETAMLMAGYNKSTATLY